MCKALSHLLLALMTFSLAQKAIAGEGAPACVRAQEAIVKLDKDMTRKSKAPVKPARSKSKSAKLNSKSREVAVSAEPPLKLVKFTPVNWTGEREAGWFQIQTFEGKLLWIRRRDLSFTWTCLQVVVVQSRMYDGPGPKFPKMEIAGKGDVFRDYGGEDGWTRVENAEGKITWINLDHTWKPTSRVRMSFQPDKN